jgi:DNA ligase-associated metallophosphoesterase
MIPEVSIDFGEELFSATTVGVLFHSATGSIIISDCHFGKTTHFRRHALPIPEKAIQKDLNRLEQITKTLNPKRIIFLGDLFHSAENREWNMLSEFLTDRIKLPLILVMGNHDILSAQCYEKAGFELQSRYFIGNIALVHDLEDFKTNSRFVISGHIHPGYRLRGNGRQQVLLPCFYVGSTSLIMPAFGSLTGLAAVEKKHKTDRVFCFTQSKIYEVP